MAAAFYTVATVKTNETHMGLVSNCRIWLGWRDSNPRMPEPKSGALPLGDTPMCLFSDTYFTMRAPEGLVVHFSLVFERKSGDEAIERRVVGRYINTCELRVAVKFEYGTWLCDTKLLCNILMCSQSYPVDM